MAPYAQTSTALGALSSATSGSWVNVPRGSNKQNTGGGAGPIVLVVATSVTTGAVVAIEGRMNGSAGATATKELHRFTVAANGDTVVPLKDLLDNGVLPEQVRLTVVSRTDGTYTGSLLTAA